MAAIISKFILFFVNLIYFLAGLTALVFGSIALADPTTIQNIFYYVPSIQIVVTILDFQGIGFVSAIILVSIGSLIVLLAILGSCGSFYKPHCIITVFGICTMVLILFEVAVIMYFSIAPYITFNTQSFLYSSLEANFNPVTIDSTTGAITLPQNGSTSLAWVELQFEQGCCGAYNSSDYLKFTWANRFNINGQLYVALVPPSCCMQIDQYTIPTNINQFADITTCLTSYSSYVNKQGCYEYVSQVLNQINYVIIIFCGGLIALQVLVIGLSVRVAMEALKVKNHV